MTHRPPNRLSQIISLGTESYLAYLEAQPVAELEYQERG